MKKINLVILFISLIISCLSHAVITSARPDTSIEVQGVLQRYLQNVNGEVNGLLLTDGTQIIFPSHMSAKLVAIVAPKDKIYAKGFRENYKVFSAETITNTKTNLTVAEFAPYLNSFEENDVYPDLDRPLYRFKINNTKNQNKLNKFTLFGKIQTQLLDRHGRITGALLNENSIVYFGSLAEIEADLNVDVGQTIMATGYGTKNIYGIAIDAETMSNK